ncbi:hypothetical protein MED222_05825 [Vibrio sp. MED222]|nr:hypothetical protein MED222_05825 [Vibrio sp. MED222]
MMCKSMELTALKRLYEPDSLYR